MALYDPVAIRATINERLDEAQALSALAAADDRQPTDEESSRINEIMAEVGLTAHEAEDNQPTGLQAQLVQAERFQSMLNNRPQRGGDGATTTIATANESPVGVHSGIERPRFNVPQNALRRRGRLVAFKETEQKPYARHEAYACGRWLLAVLGDGASMDWCRDHEFGVKNAQLERDNSLGGFFVPEEMSSRIIDLRYRYGVFRRFADVEPMASDTKKIPRRKSGVTAYALGEGAAFTESDIDFTEVQLVAKKWGALVKVSDELDEDSIISFADRVVGEMAWAFAKKEDESGFIGDGTSTYNGISGIVTKANTASHAGALYTTPTGIIAYSDLTLAHFETMAGQLPSWADDTGDVAWYCHKVAWANSILGLMNAVGGQTMADLGNGPEMMFMGYPVRFTPVMNSTLTDQAATAGLFILGALNLSSTVGDRLSGVSVKVLNELYAANGYIGLRGHTRSDINNHSITDPEDQTGATAGAVVVMKTGAAS